MTKYNNMGEIERAIFGRTASAGGDSRLFAVSLGDAMKDVVSSNADNSYLRTFMESLARGDSKDQMMGKMVCNPWYEDSARPKMLALIDYFFEPDNLGEKVHDSIDTNAVRNFMIESLFFHASKEMAGRSYPLTEAHYHAAKKALSDLPNIHLGSSDASWFRHWNGFDGKREYGIEPRFEDYDQEAAAAGPANDYDDGAAAAGPARYYDGAAAAGGHDLSEEDQFKQEMMLALKGVGIDDAYQMGFEQLLYTCNVMGLSFEREAGIANGAHEEPDLDYAAFKVANNCQITPKVITKIRIALKPALGGDALMMDEGQLIDAFKMLGADLVDKSDN